MENTQQTPLQTKQQVKDANLPAFPQAIIERAQEHEQRQEWNEVVVILKPYLDENPYDGDRWLSYGIACESLNRYEEAIAAYYKAVAYGSKDLASLAYHLGRTLAQQGKGDEALQWLDIALRFSLHVLQDLENDAAWDSLRHDPRFIEQLPPQAPDSTNRITGWRMDLKYLTKRVEQVHHDLFGRMNSLTQAQWQAAIEQLDQRIPALADHEIVAELMKIIVLVGDGHTKLYPFDVKQGYLAQQKELHLTIPLMFYAFKDGLFIRAASPRYADLVGARVLALGNLPVEQALAAVSQIVSRDNEMGLKSESASMFSHPAILHALQISDKPDQLTIQLAHEGGAPFTANIEAERHDIHWRRRGGIEPVEWVSLRATEKPIPLWLKDPDNFYWFEYLKEKQVVYCQYNQVGNKQEESLEDFCSRLFEFIETHEVMALILDIRLNGGGNLTTYRPLLHGLIQAKKINQKGHFFTIIGRRTFSAAQHFSGRLELHTQTTFVGEPTGSRPNFVGETNKFKLPFSGLEVSVSNRYWQGTFDFDRRMWIAPSVCTEMTAHDYKIGRDPALEAILSYF